ncbi:MAG: rhomboid family intramembrane serine protease [Candidatus Riflebacteria bacterium]|nr:rhomboid family intramembrane serine protease [Candidatus Riflebacteria bacterium]
MELAYRLLIYILIANVGYMIFSLSRKGFKHYSGYISQLFFLFCLMIVLIARDFSGGLALSVSLIGILILVLFPIFLQRQIDALMSENRFAEIEPYARWKANLAWSELNVHMHNIARLAEEYGEDPARLEAEVRALLDRGEPYDEMTRIFLGLIHFNNRNFEALINDLRVAGKGFDQHSFEELLYLVRAYLETTRYDEAIEAQLALERKINDPEDASVEKRANLVISRMIFMAFLGWHNDLLKLMESGEEGLERLPTSLRDFWLGVALFNAGRYDEGEKAMAFVIKKAGEEQDNESWLPFMRKRFFGLVENRDFFDRKVLPHLQALHEKFSDQIQNTIGDENQSAAEAVPKNTATNVLTWLTMAVSIYLMMSFNVEDIVSLVEIGANSSFLVLEGEYFRLFTYQFIHIGLIHLLMNVVALKFFGPPIETLVGWPIFLGLYFFSGVAGGLAAVHTGQPLSAGASAAVLGLLSAAIIFEFFSIKGAEKLSQRNNFSTLIFILVINLIIGAVEKGVDNSAHVGGLAGGALLALALIPILSSALFKRIAGFVAVWGCIFLAATSIWQMFSGASAGHYPQKIAAYAQIRNASDTFSIDLPASWKIDAGENSLQSLEVTGPFRERVSILIGLNEDSVEKVIEDYVTQRTSEIEKSREIILKSRRGPELMANLRTGTYRIRWLLNASGGPLSVVDYLIFEGEMLFLVRFFIGTERDIAYDELMNHSVKSFYFNRGLK